MPDFPPADPGQDPSFPRWTDSHCHLAMADFDVDRAEVGQRAEAAGVRRLVVVGTTPEDWGACAELAREPGRRSTAGLHPHEASRWNAPVAEALAVALRDPAAAAVGEIGLDYHYDLSPREAQLEAFAAQLSMAAERDMPVVVHSREAFQDTVNLMRPFTPRLRGIIHCFTYGPSEAEAFLAMGLHLSFSGIVTFPKAPLIREAARLVPWSQLLVETDAPYLAPAPHRGKRCEPAQVAVVGRFLAELKGVPESEAARVTSANAARLFGWEGAGSGERGEGED